MEIERCSRSFNLIRLGAASCLYPSMLVLKRTNCIFCCSGRAFGVFVLKPLSLSVAEGCLLQALRRNRNMLDWTRSILDLCLVPCEVQVKSRFSCLLMARKQ